MVLVLAAPQANNFIVDFSWTGALNCATAYYHIIMYELTAVNYWHQKNQFLGALKHLFPTGTFCLTCAKNSCLLLTTYSLPAHAYCLHFESVQSLKKKQKRYNLIYMAGSNFLFTVFGSEVDWALHIDVWMGYKWLFALYVVTCPGFTPTLGQRQLVILLAR